MKLNHLSLLFTPFNDVVVLPPMVIVTLFFFDILSLNNTSSQFTLFMIRLRI